MAQRLQTLEHGNHIIAVYSNKDEKFNEAFAFLKEGLQRNEVVVLTTTDLPKDQIRDRIRKEWEVDVEELESRGDIIIRTTEELYFPDGIPNIQRTMALWSTLVENSLSKGKRGIRVFGDMTAFFRKGFTKELFEYELCLEPRFNFPAIGICAYPPKAQAVIDTLSEQNDYGLIDIVQEGVAILLLRMSTKDWSVDDIPEYVRYDR